MTQNSVGDEPRFAPDGVVGDVVIPHHVERIGAGFAIIRDPENVRAVRDVGRCVFTGDIFRFVEWNEVGLP
jgi:hypothetical protein